MVDGTAASPRLVRGALATQDLLFADDAPMALVRAFRDGGPADQDELAQQARMYNGPAEKTFKNPSGRLGPRGPRKGQAAARRPSGVPVSSFAT